jgi:hypothetical protein
LESIVSSQKKSLVQTLKSHETAIVETAAVLTASTRWVITFSPIDKTNLAGIIASMGWLWDAISAILSISFAVVEIWATAMIMRAFNIAKDRKDKFFLGAVWFVSLVVLAMVQIPPLYASLMDVPVSTLEGWNALYVVATSVAAFVVIAGVSYADRFKAPLRGEGEDSDGDFLREGFAADDELQKRVEEMTETVGTTPQLPTEPMHGQTEQVHMASPDTRIVVNGYEEFKSVLLGMNGNRPRTGAQVGRTFKMSPKTAYKYLERFESELGA